MWFRQCANFKTTLKKSAHSSRNLLSNTPRERRFIYRLINTSMAGTVPACMNVDTAIAAAKAGTAGVTIAGATDADAPEVTGSEPPPCAIQQNPGFEIVPNLRTFRCKRSSRRHKGTNN